MASLVIQLPYGWRKECVQRPPGGKKANHWDFALVPPSNFIRKLRRKSQLEEYLARNPEVPIDSTVTNFSAPKKGSSTSEVVVAAAPKLVNGTPDVGEASLPARSSSPPVKLSARPLSQAASRNDAADNWIEK